LNGLRGTGHHAPVTTLSLPLPVMSITPEVSDDDLVARLREGDRAAVEHAYVTHHAAVRGFARRLVGDAAAAEDLVHETFVALPRAIRRYRGDAPLRSFLMGIAVNHARRHVRAAMRRRRATEKLAAASALRAPPADASEALDRKRMADRLSAALDELPIEQRVAFVLCEAEGRTSVEVAEILGVPEGTVRTRLFHAKRKLRLALEGFAPGGER
jgi:RNA polymerase sigma-70 factor (ECF subfamily)